MNNKIRNAIYGLAMGDALGVPYEFLERDTFHCTEFIGHGSHNQEKGTFSDDTSMTLATLKSLKDNNDQVNIEDMKSKFEDWLMYGDYAIDQNVFDIGNTTYTAIKKGKGSTSEYSNGNGSLMRILPLAFMDCTDEEIKAVSAITHAHKVSKEACVIYVHIARRLLNGETLKDILPTLKYDAPFHRLSIIDSLQRNEIKSSGYVIDTLEAALWCIVKTNTYKDAVIMAVNLGSDTDTVAAVTGGLAGIIYDVNREEDWIHNLRGKDIIEECL